MPHRPHPTAAARRSRRGLAALGVVGAALGLLVGPAAGAAPAALTGSATTAVPVAAARAAATGKVVQLGDSYSAGNGAGDYVEKSCYRSPFNYGAQVAASVGAAYVNAACSGGVVADILEPRPLGDEFPRTATYPSDPASADPEGDWLRAAQAAELCGHPSQPDFRYDYRLVAGVEAAGLYTGTAMCQLVARPQIDSVDRGTTAVYVTIGGNDLGFSTIVANCLVVRDPSSCRTALESARANAPRMMERTEDALRAVLQRSGGRAEIYLLSYPFLLGTESYGIPEAAPTYDAGAALNALQTYGDDVQAQGIARLNAEAGPDRYHYVSGVKAAWGVHAHGLDPRTVPDNSDAWLVPVAAPGRDQPEWVHPTRTGWSATATALRSAVASVG